MFIILASVVFLLHACKNQYELPWSGFLVNASGPDLVAGDELSPNWLAAQTVGVSLDL